MSIVENPIGLGKIYGPSSYFTHWGEMIAEEGSHGLLIAMDGIYARMFRMSDPERRIAEVAERMQVTHRLDDRVRTLSHGLAKRVALARALLHAPRLLLLDEPESGLDQSALKLLEGIIAEYRTGGRAVIMTTHSVEHGLESADHVVALSRGRVVVDGPRSQVNAQGIQAALGEVAGALSR